MQRLRDIYEIKGTLIERSRLGGLNRKANTRVLKGVFDLIRADICRLHAIEMRSETQSPAGVAGQPAAANSWAPSRTPWGAPDLQGVWDYRTITPLQRSPELAGQEFLSEEQAAEFERANAGSSLPAWSWWEDKLELTDDRRTSLIVDPPDGRIPSLTPEAEARVAAMAIVHRRPPEHPEDRTLFERCLVGRASGPPMIPSLLHYDSRVQVFQTPGYVVLFNEMIHETRVVPLDGRPHVPSAIRQWLGDSRGHWEGDTLVVETTNFTDQTNYGGWGFGDPYYRIPLVGANMHLVERFTRVDADTIAYEFTVDQKLRTLPLEAFRHSAVA